MRKDGYTCTAILINYVFLELEEKGITTELVLLSWMYKIQFNPMYFGPFSKFY